MTEERVDGNGPNIKKWVVLYPIYINSKKTIAEGRRISALKACENPTCEEIRDCCTHLKLPVDIEREKSYPRDFFERGRVRVLLKREDGSLCNPAIPSRKQLLVQVAELVQRHPGRTRKQELAATSSVAPSKSGKGGKKKRRVQHCKAAAVCLKSVAICFFLSTGLRSQWQNSSCAPFPYPFSFILSSFLNF